MQITIAAVGKLKAGPERELCRRYTERVDGAGRTVNLGPLNTLEIPESRKADARERRAQEAGALLDKLPGAAVLIALDEKGSALASEDLARQLAETRDAGAPALAFLLGGPDGHGEQMRENASRLVSLGAITLPHGLARVVLAEQIYRAVTILAGHPYHRA